MQNKKLDLAINISRVQHKGGSKAPITQGNKGHPHHQKKKAGKQMYLVKSKVIHYHYNDPYVIEQ